MLQGIKNLTEAMPFKPFVIYTADGRQFRVGHPEFAHLLRLHNTVIIEEEEDATKYQIISGSMITGIAVEGEPARV